jgi:tetratricopeptide (TPR) repeat protein
MIAQRIAGFMYSAFARPSMATAVVTALAIGLATTASGSPQSRTKTEVQEPKPGTKYNSAEEAYRAGAAYLTLKKEAESQEPFEQALKMAPDDKFKLKVYEALIPAYTLLPEIDKKVEALEFIIDKTDSAAKRSLARRSLMSFVHQRGKTEAIATRYEDAIKKDPKNRTALYILAEVYATLKSDPRRAVEVTEKLAAVMKEHGEEFGLDAQAGLAGLYVKAERFKEAAELYEKVANGDPKLASSHWKDAALAWLRLKEKDKALGAAKKADASPTDNRGGILEHFWHKAMGDIYLETSEAKLAIPHYEKAIEKTNIAGYIKDCQKKLAEARAKAGQ